MGLTHGNHGLTQFPGLTQGKVSTFWIGGVSCGMHGEHRVSMLFAQNSLQSVVYFLSQMSQAEPWVNPVKQKSTSSIPPHKNAFQPHHPLLFPHQTPPVPPPRRLFPPRARASTDERLVTLFHAVSAIHPLPLAVIAHK